MNEGKKVVEVEKEEINIKRRTNEGKKGGKGGHKN